MKEAEIVAGAAKKLRGLGFYVRVFPMRRRVPSQWRGWCDILAIRGGLVLFIECKVPGQKLRPDQAAFRDAILRHEGPHARYVLLTNPDEIEIE